MPDWTYQTVFRPLLFRLSPRSARSLALGVMGTLGRMPWGTRIIELMGHMRPDPRLEFHHRALQLPTQVGLSCWFDSRLQATEAFSKFGFGFLEIGPIVPDAPDTSKPLGEIGRTDTHCQLLVHKPFDTISQAQALARFRQYRRSQATAPLFLRLEAESADGFRQLIAATQHFAAALVVDCEQLPQFLAADEEEGTHRSSCDVQSADGQVDSVPARLACLTPQQWSRPDTQQQLHEQLADHKLQGVVLGSDPGDDGTLVLGKSQPARVLQCVTEMRQVLPNESILICATGMIEPADALDAVDAGADLVQVDAGLVYSGPGIPKRINEAMLYRRIAGQATPERRRAGQSAWFWAFLMGLGMLLGGILAMLIATTRVVLPYDESLAGLTRNQLAALNDHLLDFMTHDRVTLAGTMLAVGLIYCLLSWFGIRRGVHWAWLSVVASAFAGFASFFSFLGFGYFDPFHAFVTAVLLQLLLLAVHSDLPLRFEMEPPDLWNDRAWSWNQWGQLIFVVHGGVLITAGIVISIVGMTTVFVPEDLEFMETSADQLFGAHPQLVPLVAHDRATFGGMLVACGVVTTLSSLWGFRRGQSWLWWALVAGGSIAYIATIAVHWTVGYDSLKHLLPAYGGLAALWMGGALSYPFLVARDENLLANWQARLARPAR